MNVSQDYVWNQGSDLIIHITYKVNDEPVDLSNYAARMDVAPIVGGQPAESVIIFNSEDIDHALDDEGNHDNEITLGADGVIQIRIHRKVTLPGGQIGDLLAQTRDFGYDLFIRDKGNDTQKKLLEGKITVRKSITKWL